MKNSWMFAASLAMLAACGTATEPADNTAEEMNKKADEGWVSLLDANSTKGWHSFNKPDSIGAAWSVTDGILHLDASQKNDWQTVGGGDIVSADSYDNFHLKLEWKIAPKGNSGIMFYVQESPEFQYPWQTGPEMQVLDNEGHPDAKIHKHRAGDLYDLIASSKETVKPAGEWNQVEIVSNGGKLDFFLNGENVVSTTLWDSSWNALVAGSKFKDMPGFGKYKSGKIALQDHGDDVWYRNIMIRRL